MTHTMNYGEAAPIWFSASTEAVIRPRVVNGWLVGSPADDRLSFAKFVPDVSGHEPELKAWFQECVSLAEFDPVPWIVRNGAFRDFDWKPVADVFALDLPPKVKAEIKALKLGKNSQVYVLRVEHIQKELHLLKYLAQIAEALSSKRWGVLRGPVEESDKLLLALKWELGQGVYGQLDEKLSKKAGATPQEWIENARSLLEQAFTRVLAKSGLGFSMDNGPGLAVEVTSILGLLYVCLLANFNQWRICKRPDCRKVFVAESGREKKYCTWYCGHIETVRRGRRRKHRHLRPTKVVRRRRAIQKGSTVQQKRR